MPKRKASSQQQNVLIVGLLTLIILLAISVFNPNNPNRPSLTKKFKKTAVQVDEGKELNDYIDIVAPESGFTIPLKWGDTGIKLVAAGGIDLAKYRDNYPNDQYGELLSYLTEYKDKGITITRDNAYFWVNTLWALGLTQQSQVLDQGVMGTEYKDQVGNFASTGGWTLGSTDAVSLYSSSGIIPLTEDQQALVAKVASEIYRPCCGNPTSFPDCNHGMAILGLLELMASQGFSESDMYAASLAFNSYWFTQTYAELAYYFENFESKSWDQVKPALVLSEDYSSAGGYQSIKQQIGTVPGGQMQGGSCGA